MIDHFNNQAQIEFHASRAKRCLLASGVLVVLTAVGGAITERGLQKNSYSETDAVLGTILVGVGASVQRRKATVHIRAIRPDFRNQAQAEQIQNLQAGQRHSNHGGEAALYAGISGFMFELAHNLTVQPVNRGEGLGTLATLPMIASLGIVTGSADDYVKLTKIAPRKEANLSLLQNSLG